MVTSDARCTVYPRADPECEILHLVHLASDAPHLRNELRTWGVYWELIPGTGGWIQTELTSAQVLRLAMEFPDNAIDILE